MENPKTITARKEDIQFLMKYAVPEGDFEAAEALLEKFESDIIGLNLLHSFQFCLLLEL